MTPLLGSIGWGLFALGAVTHVWHHRRLRELLGRHTDHEALAAFALTAAEVAIAIALPTVYFADLGARTAVAIAAGGLALGFFLWILRLLLTDSELPCACAFTDDPTSMWSLGRAGCTALAGLFAVTDPSSVESADRIAILTVGLAVAAAVFVVPEAVTWPEASRASLARIDAHAPGAEPTRGAGA